MSTDLKARGMAKQNSEQLADAVHYEEFIPETISVNNTNINVAGEINGINSRLADITQQMPYKHLLYFAPVCWTNEAFSNRKNETCDWNSSLVKGRLDYYCNLGMNTIVLQPCTYISDSGINKRYINLELAIRYLKGKNKKVAIRLHVFNDNANQTITTTLNNNFKSYALEVASLCQNEGVDIFFIGCEIAESFDLYNDSYMRDIVSSIKNAYKGAVSYGATTIEVEQITWWDCCDFVGVDFYPRTTKNINADFTELLSGYYASRNNRLKLNNNQKTTPYEFLKYFYNKWNKPIYITEWDIVYGSASNHAVNGIGDSYYSGLDFGKIQAMAMDAMMTFQSECDFIVGSNIWCELIDDGADTWDDGKFRGRTNSENIVRKWGELIGY